ncbi:MAG: carbon storage regulator CsrA, partial [Planctomycetota bacterium]
AGGDRDGGGGGMLVLTRTPSQEIRIGHDIVVRVLDVKGERVRIGIDAPSEISVHRQEVYLEIAKANRESSNVADPGVAKVMEIARNRGENISSKSALRGRPKGSPGAEVNHGA